MKRLFLFIAFALSASGYAQTWNTYSTSTGCKVMLRAAGVEQPVHWTGECRNGFVQGVGQLTYQFDATDGTARWHIKGFYSGGIANGVIWIKSDPMVRSASNDQHGLAIEVTSHGERRMRQYQTPEVPLAQALSAGESLHKAAEPLAPIMGLAELMRDIQMWHQNPRLFAGAVQPGANLFANAGSSSNSRDDPKVRGRSARGG